MNEFVLILGMALVTFAIRYPMLVLVGRVELPDNLIRALRYVPVAVLTAIIVPAVIMPEGAPDISLSNSYLVGGVIAALIAWRTRNLLLTIGGGMVIFLVWRAIAGA